MKNITALKILVIIISMFIFINSAYSQTAENGSKYGVFISPQFGFVYGQAAEIVFPQPGETKNNLLSELIWDMKPVFYLGLQAQFSRKDLMKKPGFFSLLSFKAGIPANSGVMEDRDWLSPANNELTHFSSHTNKTSQLFTVDAAVGFTLPVKLFFYFKPFFSFSWMHFSFTGKDGYGIYPSGNVSFSGKEVIRYKQDWLIFSQGLSAGVKILPQLTLDISFKISLLTYCTDTDEHLLTDTKYIDITAGGLYLEPSFNITYSVKKTDFMLNISYKKISNTSGSIYESVKNKDYQLSPNKAGAGLSLFDMSFTFRILLF